MSKSIPEQLRFPPVDGMTVRADFEGGTLSSDFGPMLLRGIDHQIGLTHCLAQAFDDQRHPSYTDHPLRNLLAQRIYQAFTKSPAAMRMAMTPTPCAKMPFSSWGWIASLWIPTVTWPAHPPFPVWKMRRLPGMFTAWPKPLLTNSSPVTNHPHSGGHEVAPQGGGD